MFLKKKTLGYTKTYLDKVDEIKDLLDKADYILIGAGAGLSASGGINYVDENLTKEWFPEYYKQGLKSIVEIQSVFWNLREDNVLYYWSYWAKHIYNIRYKSEALEPYQSLYKILKEKNYFIITTNVDGQFEKAGFSKDKIFAPQGEYRLFQCSKPCSDELYDNKDIIEKIIGNMKDEYKIKKEDIPICPRCGEYLIPNLRIDSRFVEGYHLKNADKYEEFVRTAKGKRFVLLELGVGFNTPIIIRYPFENIVSNYTKNTRLVRINMDYANVSKEIEEKSITIQGDIREVLNDILSSKK